MGVEFLARSAHEKRERVEQIDRPVRQDGPRHEWNVAFPVEHDGLEPARQRDRPGGVRGIDGSHRYPGWRALDSDLVAGIEVTAVVGGESPLVLPISGGNEQGPEPRPAGPFASRGPEVPGA